MTERRTLGDILVNLDRIDESEVAQALEYQRDHGGYFGEALVALGFVTQEELEFGLASQFDLPYIFPEADSIDPEAANLVSPEWALAHLTLPITMTSDSLTVVVDSPTKGQAIEELSRWTEREIHLALASAGRIRELIREIYARPTTAEGVESPVPLALADGFGLALEAASSSFGVSVRKGRSWFWYDDGGTVRRRPLEGAWDLELDRLVSPPPSEGAEPGTRALTVQVNREGMVTPAEARYMSSEFGRELLFRPISEDGELEERFPPPSPGLLSEVRLLARSGSARFLVTTEPTELGPAVLPHLPHLLLEPSWRSVHVHSEDRPMEEEAFSLTLPEDPGAWDRELEELRAFHLDVVTVDVGGSAENWIAAALDVAAVAFLRWETDEDIRVAYDAGVRWELRVEGEEGSRLTWSLDPIQV